MTDDLNPRRKARQLRIRRPPSTGDSALDRWLLDLHSEVNRLPAEMAYSTMWTNGGLDQDFGTSFSDITAWEEADFTSNLSSSLTDGFIEIQEDGGTYYLAFFSNLTTDDNDRHDFRLQKNGASAKAVGIVSRVDPQNANESQTAVLSSVLTADSGDSFSIAAKTATGTSNMEFLAAHFSLFRLQ